MLLIIQKFLCCHVHSSDMNSENQLELTITVTYSYFHRVNLFSTSFTLLELECFNADLHCFLFHIFIEKFWVKQLLLCHYVSCIYFM
jgi:hypothetical protein